jgi:hypothetical protein
VRRRERGDGAVTTASGREAVAHTALIDRSASRQRDDDLENGRFEGEAR